MTGDEGLEPPIVASPVIFANEVCVCESNEKSEAIGIGTFKRAGLSGVLPLDGIS
jgi:hypothetical protein